VALDPPTGSDPGSSPEAASLIFVSDASAEAERLMTMLRGRGYGVVDVPLTLLLSRASVQRPSIILCDADTAQAIETIKRLHEVQGRVDVILAIGTQAAQAAKAATTTVPIVFLNNADPRAVGLVASLAKPGGNLTGVLIAPEGSLAPKKLELLKEAVPRATRIAFIFPEDYGAGAELQVRDIKEAGVALRVDVPVVRVKSRNYAAAFAAVTATKAEALFFGAHSLFLSDRRIVIDLATKHRLPAIYEWPSFVKDGGLMSYGASDIETYRKVATYLDIVLKGANAGDVPIWQPTNLYLVVNTRAAKEIGLTLPPAILLRADELVQ